MREFWHACRAFKYLHEYLRGNAGKPNCRIISCIFVASDVVVVTSITEGHAHRPKEPFTLGLHALGEAVLMDIWRTVGAEIECFWTFRNVGRRDLPRDGCYIIEVGNQFFEFI